MPKLPSFLKRVVIGRALRSDTLGDTLLSKRIALPVFASDAMSSVAYAPEEILRTLALGGLAAYSLSPRVGIMVCLVMVVVVASYRQNVHAYSSGGGGYEVASVNLGRSYGLGVASALLVDYVLTVAVSIASAGENIGSAIPMVAHHKVLFCVIAIALITAANLRGMKESGITFAIPTYAFIVSIAGMIGWGIVQIFILDRPLVAESSHFELSHHAAGGLTTVAMGFLLLRSFSSGCAALTGVEAISNGVPAFKPPKSKNAATTLVLMAIIAITLFMGLLLLANKLKVTMAEDPATQLLGIPIDYHQKTLIAQIAEVVFADFRWGFYTVAAVTGLILVLAANTAFSGFPLLASVLAQDRFLPRQFYTRGDRLAFSNGILFLSGFAALLIIAFNAEATHLIQLYIVGVFISFTISQLGMVRHWGRYLTTTDDKSQRRKYRRSQLINVGGLLMTAAVLVVVLLTKFMHGVWIAVVAMAVIYVIMLWIRRHYDRVAIELTPERINLTLPARNHAIVLVSRLHHPTLRAIAYARATRPDTITAVTVNVDSADTARLHKQWEAEKVPISLTVIDSPYREVTGPVIDYVKRVRRQSPRDVVTVFIPEYVVGKWWENLLHNHSAFRIKARLLFLPGVMMTSVPWQLDSSSPRMEAMHVE